MTSQTTAETSGPWGATATASPLEATPSPAPTSAPVQRINSTDFAAAQRANRGRTWLLILVLIALGFVLGYLAGWAVQAWAEDDNFRLLAVSRLGLAGGGLLMLIGFGSAVVTLAAGDKVVLAMNSAREVSASEEPVLHNVVEEMTIAAGLPKPKVYVVESAALNAFATGMSTRNAAIAVTRGLLQSLNREQLQGVVAHEMGHVLNLDTRYMTAVGIMVGLIALVADFALRSMRFVGTSGSGSRRSKEKDGGGGAQLIVLAIFILFAILAPIAAQMVRFAVSRQREYLADATSVQLTRNPQGLISALEVLDAGNNKAPEIGNRATQHLFIVNPLRNFSGKTPALFATHPSIQDRIERLRNLGKI
jgi:heat shock protein HtpX